MPAHRAPLRRRPTHALGLRLGFVAAALATAATATAQHAPSRAVTAASSVPGDDLPGLDLEAFVEAYVAAHPASARAALRAERSASASTVAAAWMPTELALDVWNVPLTGADAGLPMMTMAFARQTFPARGRRAVARAEAAAAIEAARLEADTVRVTLALEAAGLHARLVALPRLLGALAEVDEALARATVGLQTLGATDPRVATARVELDVMRAERAMERATLQAESEGLEAVVARRLGQLAPVTVAPGVGPTDEQVRAAVARHPAVVAAAARVRAAEATAAREDVATRRAEVTAGLGAFYDLDTGLGLGGSAMVRLPDRRDVGRAARRLAALEVEEAQLEASVEAEQALREVESMLVERAQRSAEVQSRTATLLPARMRALELARARASAAPDTREALADADVRLALERLALAAAEAEWAALDARLHALYVVAQEAP